MTQPCPAQWGLLPHLHPRESTWDFVEGLHPRRLMCLPEGARGQLGPNLATYPRPRKLLPPQFSSQDVSRSPRHGLRSSWWQSVRPSLPWPQAHLFQPTDLLGHRKRPGGFLSNGATSQELIGK